MYPVGVHETEKDIDIGTHSMLAGQEMSLSPNMITNPIRRIPGQIYPKSQSKSIKRKDKGSRGTFCGDVSEDGYRWRKYGMKKSKHNHVTSYFHCAVKGCPAKKIIHENNAGTRLEHRGQHSHPKPIIHRRYTTDPASFKQEVGKLSLFRSGDGTLSTLSGEPVDPEDIAAHDELLAKRRVVIHAPMQLDDGIIWRKYGQKTTSGVTRLYFRCAVAKCPAKKLVRRQDDMEEIVYENIHNHLVSESFPKKRACVNFSERSRSAASSEHTIPSQYQPVGDSRGLGYSVVNPYEQIEMQPSQRMYSAQRIQGLAPVMPYSMPSNTMMGGPMSYMPQYSSMADPSLYMGYPPVQHPSMATLGGYLPQQAIYGPYGAIQTQYGQLVGSDVFQQAATGASGSVPLSDLDPLGRGRVSMDGRMIDPAMSAVGVPTLDATASDQAGGLTSSSMHQQPSMIDFFDPQGILSAGQGGYCLVPVASSVDPFLFMNSDGVVKVKEEHVQGGSTTCTSVSGTTGIQADGSISVRQAMEEAEMIKEEEVIEAEGKGEETDEGLIKGAHESGEAEYPHMVSSSHHNSGMPVAMAMGGSDSQSGIAPPPSQSRDIATERSGSVSVRDAQILKQHHGSVVSSHQPQFPVMFTTSSGGFHQPIFYPNQLYTHPSMMSSLAMAQPKPGHPLTCSDSPGVRSMPAQPAIAAGIHQTVPTQLPTGSSLAGVSGGLNAPTSSSHVSSTLPSHLSGTFPSSAPVDLAPVGVVTSLQPDPFLLMNRDGVLSMDSATLSGSVLPGGQELKVMQDDGAKSKSILPSSGNLDNDDMPMLASKALSFSSTMHTQAEDADR
ncbi:WRKY transcription factor, plant like protein [Aduncisulcus paluster]|uniref:WRKY transcription factor, plant like protein n=1 Tax=Aduncisulcus paluster TaxID=2918883 RepID=A0ABQ5KRS3_9EUKA|nr:WRKY transcription factor, plant like protein [Aduncisulcus paluster]